MSNLKATIKNAALQSLRSTGYYDIAGNSVARRHKLLILCYHGLALRDEDKWAGHLFITPQLFRERLNCLRQLNAEVLPLGEAVTRLQNGTLPSRSVAITFDDGFYDFLHHGVPLLNEFGYPATLYLTTYYSGRPYPITDLMIDYLLWKSGKDEVAFPEQGINNPMPVSDWLERSRVVLKIRSWFDAIALPAADKDDFARKLAVRFGIDYDDLLRSRIAQIMTPEEAAAVHRAGIDLELHTHRHRTPRKHDLFLREIQDNRSRLMEITGREPAHFCYPSGVYADLFLPWLREARIQTATTCERGFAKRDSDPLLLPRLLDDSNMATVQFEAFVSGVLG